MPNLDNDPAPNQTMPNLEYVPAPNMYVDRQTTIYEIATGKALKRAPVDIREMLARAPELYSLTPPNDPPMSPGAKA